MKPNRRKQRSIKPYFRRAYCQYLGYLAEVPVGTHWEYSNLGIDLAGYILQERSGAPFPQFVQQKVLDPLGMTHSTMDYQRVRTTKDRAIGHSPMPFRPPAERLIIPSGGVWTTAEDMAR